MDSPNSPADLPRPPRRVRGGVGCGLWFVRLFIMPHMCIGIGLAGLCVLMLLTTLFGNETSAIVTKAHTTTTSKGGTRYTIDYRYSVDGRAYTNSSDVTASTYATLNDPQKIETGLATVRISHVGFGSLRFPLVQGDSAWSMIGFLSIMALFWNGIVSVFVYFIWIAPLRVRWLVRHGTATTGKIISRRTARGKGTRYYATFKYREPVSGQEFQREMQISDSSYYEEAKEGRPVTVLYDPRKPKRAVAYELSGYRVG